jgi:hypothetical protein
MARVDVARVVGRVRVAVLEDVLRLLGAEHLAAGLLCLGRLELPRGVTLLGKAGGVRADVCTADVGEELGLRARALRAGRTGAGLRHELGALRVEGCVDEAQHVAAADLLGRPAVGDLLVAAPLEQALRRFGLQFVARDPRDEERHRGVELAIEEGGAPGLAERAELHAGVDRRLGLADLGGDLLDAQAVLLVEVAVAVGLLEGVNVGAAAVLDHRRLEDVAVFELADDGRDLRQAGEDGGAQTAVAVDELEALALRPHAHRHHDAVLHDALGEALERLLVERLAGVEGALVYVENVEHLEGRGSGHGISFGA